MSFERWFEGSINADESMTPILEPLSIVSIMQILF